MGKNKGADKTKKQVSSAMEAHGGKIKAESKSEGKGAAFAVTLPKSKETLK